MTEVGVGIQGAKSWSSALLWLNFDAIIFMQYDIAEIRWLREHGWQGEAWLRWYHPNSMSLSPEALAQEIYAWLCAEDDVGISHIILWNELNLVGEHGGELFEGRLSWDCVDAYIAINAWCCQVMAAFRALTRKYIIHWGALSPNRNPPGYEPEYEYNLLAASVRYADMVDIHVYGPVEDEANGCGRVKAIIAKLNRLGVYIENIAITEANQLDYIDLLRWLKATFPKLRACCWFLWQAQDPQHSAFDLVKQNLELLRDFIIANKEGQMARFQIGNRWFDSLIGQLPVRVGVEFYKGRAFSDIEELTIHHSGSDTYATTPMALATDMVQHETPERTKYPEIPYHIVIEPDGHITVCQPLDALTWHADGGEPRDGVGINNWRGVGIVLIGDFTNHPPSGPQLAALSELCPEIDFAMGWKLKRVRHSDVQATSCPGETSRGDGNWFDYLFADIAIPLPTTMQQIREYAQAILRLTDNP